MQEDEKEIQKTAIEEKDSSKGTFGVKMDRERAEFFRQKQKESGLSGAEFVDKMYEAWLVLHQNDETVNEQELRLLAHHLERIRNIFISLASGKNDEITAAQGKTQELMEQIQKLKINLLDEQRKSEENAKKVAEENVILVNQLEVLRNETAQKIAEISSSKQRMEEERLQANKMFEKADAMNQLLQLELATTRAEFQRVNSELATLKAVVHESETNYKLANEELQATSKELVLVQRNLETTHIKYSSDLADIKHQQEKGTKDITRQAELDKQQAIITLQNDFIEQRRTLLDELESIRKEVFLLRRENIEKASEINQTTLLNTTSEND